MDLAGFRWAAKVSKPLGLASICVLVLYSIYRLVLQLKIFSSLTGGQTFSVIQSIVNDVFYVALVGGAISFVALILRPRAKQPQFIRGNVLHRSGLPAVGAKVFVEGIDRTKETDKTGWFQIEVDSLQTYTVHATLDDFDATVEIPVYLIDTPARLILTRSPSPIDKLRQAIAVPSGPGPLSPIIAASKLRYCSFCGKSQDDVRALIEGSQGVYICNECTDLCGKAADEEGKASEVRASAIDLICELSFRSANPELRQSERARIAEEIQRAAENVRFRRHAAVGDTIAGARLIRVVGSGNFSTVWEAQAISAEGIPIDHKLAVKIFDQNKLTVGLMLWRFQRGIRAMEHLGRMGKLAPKSVVRLGQVASHRLAFSMDFLPNGDLERIANFRLGTAKKGEMFLQVAMAVRFAHQQGIVHRDIKPANIVLDGKMQAVLTDFDIADLQFAQTQSVYAGSLGTPQFAAPEQLMAGTVVAQPTADIYSLGKLLYFLDQEKPPPMGSTEADVTPRYLFGVTDELVRTVIHKAISYESNHRYQSVDEMLEALNYPKSSWTSNVVESTDSI